MFALSHLSKNAETHIWRASIVLFVLASVGFLVNAISIPVSLTFQPSDIEFERPQAVYMLKNTKQRLRHVPGLEVTTETNLGAVSRSSLRMSENGKPLAHPYASYRSMIEEGRGNYYHRNVRLSFTTTDNSDPRTNGRIYSVTYRLGLKWDIVFWLLGLSVALRAVFVLRNRDRSPAEA